MIKIETTLIKNCSQNKKIDMKLNNGSDNTKIENLSINEKKTYIENDSDIFISEQKELIIKNELITDKQKNEEIEMNRNLTNFESKNMKEQITLKTSSIMKSRKVSELETPEKVSLNAPLIQSMASQSTQKSSIKSINLNLLTTKTNYYEDDDFEDRRNSLIGQIRLLKKQSNEKEKEVEIQYVKDEGKNLVKTKLKFNEVQKEVKTTTEKQVKQKTVEYTIGVKRLLLVFNKIAEKILSINSKSNISDEENSKFNEIYSSNLNSNFALGEFINRLSRIIYKNDETKILLSLITFDNFLKATFGKVKITKENIYILLVCAFSISVKSNNDFYIPSGMLSSITLMENKNIYEIEMDFIQRLDYLTVISFERFSNYREQLYKKISEGML